MYNLATYRAYIRQRLEGDFRPGASSAYPDAVVLQALNEAQRLAQRELKLKRAVDKTLDMVAGTATVQVPLGVMGQRVLEVRVIDAAGDWSRLERVSYSWALEQGLNDASVSQGDPAQWCFDVSAGQIILLPTPDTSRAASVLVHYEPLLTPLRRIYEPLSTVAVAGFTNGSTATPIEDTDDVAVDVMGLVAATDEIGVVGSVSAGGGTSLATMPTRWYGISTVAGATGILTLAEAYGEPTAADQVFITAQVSDLERLYPGALGWCLPILACAEILKGSDLAGAQALEVEGLGILRVMTRDEQGQRPHGRRQTRSTPFFN
ncbi:hypothetical protein HQ520_07590 [bacterium]|nr:hypothetical protein [bacterium]